MTLLNTFSSAGQYVPTFTGQRLCLQEPDAGQLAEEDIAHGLAYQCCFNGQTRFFYSLAQHSLLVAQLVPPQHQLAALLHDGAAAYLGGMVGTIGQLWPQLSVIEKKITLALGKKFSLSGVDSPVIKRAHEIVQATEWRDLHLSAADPGNRSAPLPRRIESMAPEEAKRQFSEMLRQLVRSSPAAKSAVFLESERCLLADPALAPRQLLGRKAAAGTFAKTHAGWRAPSAGGAGLSKGGNAVGR